MAISAVSDLVLDVMQAADPANVQAARGRLAAFASNSPDTQQHFSVAASGPDGSERQGDGIRATPEAFARFEAMVLQSFFQTMLPKDTESVYGGGMAGEMWQSLLAQHLGETVAKRGGIGIADRILRDHYIAGEETMPVQGVSADPDKPVRDEQQLLSTALIHEIQRRAAQTLDPQSTDPDAQSS